MRKLFEVSILVYLLGLYGVLRIAKLNTATVVEHALSGNE